MPEFDEKRKRKFVRSLSAALRVVDNNPDKTTAVIQALTRKGGLQVAMQGLNEKYIGLILKYFMRYLGKAGLIKTILEVVQMFVDAHANKVDKFSERNLYLYLDLIERLVDEMHFCKSFCELHATYKKHFIEKNEKANAANVKEVNKEIPPLTIERKMSE